MAGVLGRIAVVFLVVLGAVLAAAPAARAEGPPVVYGFQTADGHFVLPYVQNLFSTDPVTPGSVVFGDTLYLLISPSGVNASVRVTSEQTGAGAPIWGNESFAVDASNFTVATFDLPSSTVQTDTRLCVDGGCMRFTHATPVTLIPSGIFNVGGLDLLVLSIVVLTAALLFPFTLLAKAIGRRALWSPRFRAWLWAPHFLLAFLLLIVVDFRAFDAFLGGWTFILYPVIFDVLYFLWMLQFFNVAKPVEVLRPDPQAGHALRYNRWRVWVGRLSDGRMVLIGPKWRHWFARLFGHFTVVMPARTDGLKQGVPSESALVTWRRDAVRGEREDTRIRRYRSRPNAPTPLDTFPSDVMDHREKDPPSLLYWVDSDKWLDATPPHLSFHKTVEVPAQYNSEGVMVKAPTVKERWAWPHYIDPPAQASLAGIHYTDAPVAAMGWIRAERAYRRLEEMRLALNAVRVSLFNLAQESADVQVAEIYRLLDREVLPLSDEEARQDVRSEAPTPKGLPEAEPSSQRLKDSDRPSPPKERSAGVGA